ncbi:hypothetical protein CK218_22265 [Mesorhizobium sp. WSM3879]|uniref:hypothetical protein n=1 Tax=Mesorhizobium sp. WSM3879 TaxID=2029406 RepID=UPI000BAEB4FE|nr:hypothetical protein [Mesorhizobium sp. WSM3879]PBB79077.1 hypothetical protein CK218_22265 [Mesorhizobium sp. WSM3879]
MKAAEQLALAHQRMTPAEIAANALELASLAEQMAQVLVHNDILVTALDNSLGQVMTQIRQAQNLNVTSRKSQSRDLVAELAALPYERQASRDALIAGVSSELHGLVNPKGYDDGSAA